MVTKKKITIIGLAAKTDQLAEKIDRLAGVTSKLITITENLTVAIGNLTATTNKLLTITDRLATRLDQLTTRVDRLAAAMKKGFDRVDAQIEKLALATHNEFMEVRKEMADMAKGMATKEDFRAVERTVGDLDAHLSAYATQWSREFDGHEERIVALGRRRPA
jgi:methyl-accepting chemotaxis protein